jgi:RNA polymerase sigma-70 factor (ECF subfamily)
VTELGADFRSQVVSLLPNLRALAHALTGNRLDAEDLVQATVVRALAAEHLVEPNTNLKAWLFTILWRAHLSVLRERRVSVPIDDVPETQFERPAAQVDAVALRELRKALPLVPAIRREALLLVATGGMSYDEAAATCGCAVGTIKSRVNRARADLARLLPDAPAASMDARQQQGPLPRPMVQSGNGRMARTNPGEATVRGSPTLRLGRGTAASCRRFLKNRA